MTNDRPPNPPPPRRSNRRTASKRASVAPCADGQLSDTSTQYRHLTQAEAALKESEERYRLLAETSTDGIIAIDQNDRIVFVNQATNRIFGYRQDELIGQD